MSVETLLEVLGDDPYVAGRRLGLCAHVAKASRIELEQLLERIAPQHPDISHHAALVSYDAAVEASKRYSAIDLTNAFIVGNVDYITQSIGSELQDLLLVELDEPVAKYNKLISYVRDACIRLRSTSTQ